ncbi:MAG: 30S ribosomal protein S12 methylthiotransferase RimO [Lachnospiraceae bacterium]|nr:30S ribosomal protein S12 methylthiotransferase RimO [Lachnospiraceae bacterium]
MKRDSGAKVHFISLGCDKNLVDAEQMMEILKDKGYILTENEEEADAIVINSCCFIGDAKEESIETVLEMSRLKEKGVLKAIILAGCLAERYADEIKTELPEVDAVIGTTAFDRIAEALDKALKGQSPVIREDRDRLVFSPGERSIATPGYYEYLKVAEGCDKRCTYCIIPSVRGAYRSIPMDSLIKDAEYLAGHGVRELILIAQETTVYGQDIYGRKALPELLRRLCRISGLRWIRIMYAYPEEIDDELIQVIKEEKKICKYLDMPVQHASDPILKKMGRRTSRKDIESLVHKLRREIPEIALRTTLLTGFPEETEEDHGQLLDFIREMAFDRLGVFTYSPEEGTPAAEMSGQIPDEIKKRRRDELMAAQQEVAFRTAEAQIGRELEVIVDGRIPEDHIYVCRTYRDCPDVDGLLFLPEDGISKEILSGDFLKARVIDAKEYDLIGEALGVL